MSQNPFNTGGTPVNLAPTLFVIFGATGDLFQSKILPALFHLYEKKLLPERYAVIAYGRREMDDVAFKDFAVKALRVKQGDNMVAQLSEFFTQFFKSFSYVQGEFDDKVGYDRLKTHLDSIDALYGQCTNKLFYCAVPPEYYATIFTRLAESDLTKACSDKLGWTRILVEKPFGKDVASARALDVLLATSFQETQIFRIDHYLAKETIQNLLTFRRANPLFKALWSHEYIAEVRLSIFETKDVASRAAFYDGVGALRDVGQNHLLQMLALVAMEVGTDSIREARAEALKHVRSSSVLSDYTRAQYDGFATEHGVTPDSRTETYFSLKAFVDTPRWQGVPFYLSSGKALDRAEALIEIVFGDEGNVNKLTFRIQPKEAIILTLHSKQPGLENTTIETPLVFEYSTDLPASHISDAYEKVLYDAIVGDQTLFASSDEVQASWNFVAEALTRLQQTPLLVYKKGVMPQT